MNEIKSIAQPILKALQFRSQDELLNIKAAIEASLEIAFTRGRNQSLALSLSSPAVRGSLKEVVADSLTKGEDASTIVDKISMTLTNSKERH